MPTFCRHNRFVDRCPICKQTLPGAAPRQPSTGGQGASGSRSTRARASTRRSAASRRSQGSDAHLRVYADSAPRGREDGYHCELVNGLRSSEDARRLCEELAFSNARLLEIATAPYGAYARARGHCRDGERELASWLCLLIAYLRPLEAEPPFAGIEAVFDATAASVAEGALELEIGLADVPLGPRAAHEDARGTNALEGYLTLMKRLGHAKDVSAAQASPRTDADGPLFGEQAWSPQRRFERAFERLGMPGFNRACRFELLTILGALEIYDMSADSLHLAAAQADLRSKPVARERRSPLAEISREPVLDAAKRVFGIGDVINLERRAKQLAGACGVPLAALDLALYNWASPIRATAGVEDSLRDEQSLARSMRVLGLG